jgi:hypothetical protein
MNNNAGEPVFEGSLDDVLKDKIVNHSQETTTKPRGPDGDANADAGAVEGGFAGGTCRCQCGRFAAAAAIGVGLILLVGFVWKLMLRRRSREE